MFPPVWQGRLRLGFCTRVIDISKSDGFNRSMTSEFFRHKPCCALDTSILPESAHTLQLYKLNSKDHVEPPIHSFVTCTIREQLSSRASPIGNPHELEIE